MQCTQLKHKFVGGKCLWCGKLHGNSQRAKVQKAVKSLVGNLPEPAIRA